MNIRAKRIERITLEMPLVRSDAPVRLLDLNRERAAAQQ